MGTFHETQDVYHPDSRRIFDDLPPPPPVAKPVPRLQEIEVPGVTGLRDVRKLFALPASVVADGKLKPTIQDARYRVHMFAHSNPSFVPLRFAAVVPGGLTEFTRPLLFFHPLPSKRAGFSDATYASQTAIWRSIYRYADQQGVQLAASKRKQVLIIPIFNLASTDTCGRFPAEWKTLVEDIMTMLRAKHAPGLAKDARPVVSDVVTASYSAGVKYMHTFLTKATGLSGLLREAYDYDGRFSSHKDLSEKLKVQAGMKVLTYDQRAVKLTEVVKEEAAGNGIHVPEPRWKDLPNGFTSFLDLPLDPLGNPGPGASLSVHGAMPRFMMFHSLDQSSVGK
jgi:hypothetical protein